VGENDDVVIPSILPMTEQIARVQFEMP